MFALTTFTELLLLVFAFGLMLVAAVWLSRRAFSRMSAENDTERYFSLAPRERAPGPTSQPVRPTTKIDKR